MDRTSDFAQLVLASSPCHNDDTEKPLLPVARKSLGRDVKDDYTKEAYQIVRFLYRPF
jgi:hypothetical protein